MSECERSGEDRTDCENHCRTSEDDCGGYELD